MGRAELDPTELRVDKTWLGPDKGNQVRITHVPTGIAVHGAPVAPSDDAQWFEKEKARLLSRLERELARRRRSKLVLAGLVVFLCVSAVAFVASCTPWDSYRYDIERLRGLTPAEVAAKLGPPNYDSRDPMQPDDGCFIFGYAGPGGVFGVRYSIAFENNRVVSAIRTSK